MENTNYNIEVKSAWHVTKDEIKPVQAFTMQKVGSYGATEVNYYLTEKGWKEASTYSWEGNEIAWTEEEAQKLKTKKMESHIEYLKKDVESNQKKIAEMEQLLAVKS